ncbi:ribokinase [Nocardia goodfellowii]|uniref:Ribokinase n=1 Tax=Nocardia goodfellowii TaxID=882446 RepID=A0ABS4QU27_9NOCA|nr:ribokinase [Nocardia goodfellowii]MBP2194096.1 ribokinase [Nocardia goodfellowii]
MTKPPRVAVLGSINMDLVCTTEQRPEPGETVLGTGFTMVPGGKGANQAIAARRSDALVEFLGAVGRDMFSTPLRQVLTDSDVGAARLRSLPGSSGVATIVVEQGGENSIIVTPGANAQLTELDELDLQSIAEADILLCQLEIPIDTVTAGARHARAHGTTVIVNPSPVRELPDELWRDIDVAVVNSGESDRLGETLDRVAHVITTRGANGADYRGPDEDFHCSSPKVRVVDTTGAGDAFTGALAAAWHRGPRRALAWACAAGALAATELGASKSIPDADAIAALLDDSALDSRSDR